MTTTSHHYLLTPFRGTSRSRRAGAAALGGGAGEKNDDPLEDELGLEDIYKFNNLDCRCQCRHRSDDDYTPDADNDEDKDKVDSNDDVDKIVTIIKAKSKRDTPLESIGIIVGKSFFFTNQTLCRQNNLRKQMLSKWELFHLLKM